MHKIYFFIILTVLVSFISPKISLAAEPDFYANTVCSASNQIYQPNNSLGAPDNVYTDFFDQDATITLNMGADEEGTGDLTLFFRILGFGASYRVEFLDANLIKVQTSSDTLPLSTSELTITYTGGVPYRFVTITSIENEQWSLDAIMTDLINVEEKIIEEEIITEENIPEEIITEPTIISSCGGNQGLIVKRPSDGNPDTNADSIVYTIGCNNTLHIFPDEQTFKTWWTDFDNIAYIDGAFISQHELESRVTVRPGTWLVKKTSDPKVYAVEPNNILRWIPNEITAEALYGTNWNKIIVDVPDELFSDYIIGPNLTSTLYSNGVIGYLPEGRVVYLNETSFYNLPGNILNSLRLNSKFLVPLSATIMTAYTDGGDLVYNTNLAFPF